MEKVKKKTLEELTLEFYQYNKRAAILRNQLEQTVSLINEISSLIEIAIKE